MPMVSGCNGYNKEIRGNSSYFFVNKEVICWKKIEKVLTKVLTKYQKITILVMGIIFSLILFE